MKTAGSGAAILTTGPEPLKRTGPHSAGGRLIDSAFSAV